MDLLPDALRLAALAAGVTGLLYWLFQRYLAREDQAEAADIAVSMAAVGGFLFAFGREISLVPLSLPAAPLTKLPFLLLLALAAGLAVIRHPKWRHTILSVLALIAVFWCAAPHISDNKIRVALLALLGVASAQATHLEEGSDKGSFIALLVALAGMAVIAMILGSHLGAFALALAAALCMAGIANGSACGPLLSAPALAGWLVLVSAAAQDRPFLLIPAALSAAPLLLEPSVRSLARGKWPIYWAGFAGVCVLELGFALVFVASNL